VRGLTDREAFAFGIPAALCVLLGLFPNPVLLTMKADAGVVALFGDHARIRAGVMVRRPLPELPAAVIGGPAVGAMPGGQPRDGGPPGPRPNDQRPGIDP
jgi:NADH-quinone oxidoreductase subunit M